MVLVDYNLVGFGLLLSTALTGFAVSINPKNTAVSSGTLVSYLNCSFASSNTSQIIWSFSQKNGQLAPILVGCSPSSAYPQYGVEHPTSDSCNLIIYNANALLAGLYQCAILNPAPLQVYAQFIVLGSDPVCSTTPTGQVPVDQSVKLSCGTTVAGNMWPVMTWSNSTQQLPSPQINSSSFVGSNITVQAQIPTVPSYSCNTKFTAPVNVSDGYAANAPTYTSQCNTPSLQVMYPPSAGSMNISLNGNPNNVSCQDTLSCSAQAFPTPTYTWTLPDNSTATGSTVSVAQTGTDLQYTCTATNTQGSASVSVMLNISYCPTTTAATTTTATTLVPPTGSSVVVPTTNSVNVGAIVGGVIGGVVGLVLIILLLVCCFVESCSWYHGKCCSKSPDKYKSTQSNNSAGSRSDIVRGSSTDQQDHGYIHRAPEYGMSDIPPPHQNGQYGYTQNPDGLVYAELQINNTPRSRQPIQSNTPVPMNDYDDDDFKPPYDGSSMSRSNENNAVYAGVRRAD